GGGSARRRAAGEDRPDPVSELTPVTWARALPRAGTGYRGSPEEHRPWRSSPAVASRRPAPSLRAGDSTRSSIRPFSTVEAGRSTALDREREVKRRAMRLVRRRPQAAPVR